MEVLPAIQHTTDDVKNDNTDFIVLKFADAKIPNFTESKNRDFISYGDDNAYPDYLIYLYNKSAKHNAIITGKSFYVFGNGFQNGDFIINRLNESLNDITKKAIIDTILYGGFRFEIIYNALGQISEVYHVDWNTIRLDKQNGYLFCEKWTQWTNDYEPIDPFNPRDPLEPQIFSYNQYRPGSKYYPLPDYIGCNNYIETDIEISKYYLSAIRNGMFPSKLIEFFSGEPTEDKKKEIERRFTNKFTGSENSGRIILAFNKDKGSPINITDLSATDLDKQFVVLNQTAQQEIFTGHCVTSPMLFGIKEQGQLGATNELKISYAIWNNSYGKPMADTISKEITYLLSFSIFKDQYQLEPLDPLGNQIDIHDVINSLPKEYVFRQLGIPEDMWDLENIGSDNRPTPTVPVSPNPDVIAAEDISGPVNDNIKNLTGRQQQQIERIIRKYQRKQLNEAQAKTFLRTGYGLSEDDINALLGIVAPPQPAPAALTTHNLSEDEIVAMFDNCGDVKKDYNILASRRVWFAANEFEDHEETWTKAAFADYDVTATEAKIIELIQKDPLIDAPHIASVINQSQTLVENKIKSLVSRGYIEEVEETIGGGDLLNTLIKRTIPEKIPLPKTTIDKKPTTQIMVKYSYEGPQDSRNRPFCAKLLQLDRLYTRADIEKISERLGYSVWDRRGGFWRHKGTDITTPYCRHIWKSNIVVRKNT